MWLKKSGLSLCSTFNVDTESRQLFKNHPCFQCNIKNIFLTRKKICLLHILFIEGDLYSANKTILIFKCYIECDPQIVSSISSQNENSFETKMFMNTKHATCIWKNCTGCQEVEPGMLREVKKLGGWWCPGN